MVLNHAPRHVCPILGPPFRSRELPAEPAGGFAMFVTAQAQVSAFGLARRSERTASTASDFDRGDAGNRRPARRNLGTMCLNLPIQYTRIGHASRYQTHRSTPAVIACRYRT